MPKLPSLSKQYRVSLCWKGLWGDWCLPSFSPVEHGKLWKNTPNAKVSKKDSTLSAQEQYIFYISGVAALLLVVFMHCQTAHAFPQLSLSQLLLLPARTTTSNITFCSLDCLGEAHFLERWRQSRQVQTTQQLLRQKVRVQAQYHIYSVLQDPGMPTVLWGAWKPEFNPSWITSPESRCFPFHDP